MANLNGERLETTKSDIQSLRNVPIARFFKISNLHRLAHVKCPFHNERSASFAIYPDNSFHCYGCGAHGKGAIDFVMKMGCNFLEACEELKKYV